MRRYLPINRYARKTDYPEGVRIVHNFYPGPLSDPGRDRILGDDGFRVWVTDDDDAAWSGRRCYCGWLNGHEHYGTRAVIDVDGGRA